MNTPSKQELEATVESIFSQSTEEILRMIEEAHGGIYGDCKEEVFTPVGVTFDAETFATHQTTWGVSPVLASGQGFVYVDSGVYVHLLGSMQNVQLAAKNEELALAA